MVDHVYMYVGVVRVWVSYVWARTRVLALNQSYLVLYLAHLNPKRAELTPYFN